MEKTKAIGALSALAQETRLDIFRLLVEAGPGGFPAGRVAEALGVPAATLSFHLKELRTAGLIGCRKNGRSLIYSADFAAIDGLLGYLMENCCTRTNTSAGSTAP
jgi:DNA-binding transcriptional ArsR family regulator